MPTTQSIQFEKQAAGSFLDRIDDKRQIEGEFDTALVEVELEGDEEAGDIISLIRLPGNAILLPEECRVIAGNPGTTLTGIVGDAVDDNRYSGTLTLSAGGTVPFIAANAVSFPDGFVNRHKVHDANSGVSPAVLNTRDILFEVATAAELTAGAKLYFSLKYKCL